MSPKLNTQKQVVDEIWKQLEQTLFGYGAHKPHLIAWVNATSPEQKEKYRRKCKLVINKILTATIKG